MGKIANDDEVLLELGLADSATPEERNIVIAAINQAEGAVRRHLKYDPVLLERTEFYPQMNLQNDAGLGVWEVSDTHAYIRRETSASIDELQIQHIPIRFIASLRIDYDGRFGARAGSFAASTEKTEGADFWPNYDTYDSEGAGICRDGIIRSSGAWPTSPGSRMPGTGIRQKCAGVARSR